MSLNESIVEDVTLEWFLLRRLLRQGYGGQDGDLPSPRLRRTGLRYAVVHGPHVAPGEPAAERDTFGDVVLVGRLREAISRLNPSVPGEAAATDKESLSVHNKSKGG